MKAAVSGVWIYCLQCFCEKKSKLLPLTHLEQAKFEASDKYIDHQECTNNETEAILK